MELAPIVLFVYNRPRHTKETIEALQKNGLAKESELFIYSDAPKDEKAKEGVDEVRRYIEGIEGFKRVTIVKREKNFGLARSIVDGVTKVVNEYGKVIVLEDDLITSPYFLRFMNDALERYKNEKSVWHVSGYTPPLPTGSLDGHFFLRPTTCWGWATWSDRWRHFKKDTDYFLGRFDKKRIRAFNIDNSYDYYGHILLNHDKTIDTWAIFWYATVFFSDGLSLHPKESFVKNIGHDASGVHCQSSCGYDVELSESYDPGELPGREEIVLSESMSKELSKYYKTLKKPIAARIVNKLKYIIGK
ncbi:glycosyltransferase [Hydrogenimonas sp.]